MYYTYPILYTILYYTILYYTYPILYTILYIPYTLYSSMHNVTHSIILL